MTTKNQVVQRLNELGFSTTEDLIVTLNGQPIPISEIVEPFCGGGQFEYLNFDANHICQEIVIESLKMFNKDNLMQEPERTETELFRKLISFPSENLKSFAEEENGFRTVKLSTKFDADNQPISNELIESIYTELTERFPDKIIYVFRLLLTPKVMNPETNEIHRGIMVTIKVTDK